MPLQLRCQWKQRHRSPSTSRPTTWTTWRRGSLQPQTRAPPGPLIPRSGQSLDPPHAQIISLCAQRSQQERHQLLSRSIHQRALSQSKPRPKTRNTSPCRHMLWNCCGPWGPVKTWSLNHSKANLTSAVSGCILLRINATRPTQHLPNICAFANNRRERKDSAWAGSIKLSSEIVEIFSFNSFFSLQRFRRWTPQPEPSRGWARHQGLGKWKKVYFSQVLPTISIQAFWRGISPSCQSGSLHPHGKCKQSHPGSPCLPAGEASTSRTCSSIDPWHLSSSSLRFEHISTSLFAKSHWRRLKTRPLGSLYASIFCAIMSPTVMAIAVGWVSLHASAKNWSGPRGMPIIANFANPNFEPPSSSPPVALTKRKCFFSLNQKRLQIWTDTEQLCHMECNATAKLAWLQVWKRVAPGLAISFNQMAHATMTPRKCTQPNGLPRGRDWCCALLASSLGDKIQKDQICKILA